MHTKGPLDVLVTSGSVVGGATRGLRNGFDVAPRGARAPHARPRAWPFPVTARFGHPLLENRFPSHLFRVLSLGVKPAAPSLSRILNLYSLSLAHSESVCIDFSLLPDLIMYSDHILSIHS